MSLPRLGVLWSQPESNNSLFADCPNKTGAPKRAAYFDASLDGEYENLYARKKKEEPINARCNDRIMPNCISTINLYKRASMRAYDRGFSSHIPQPSFSLNSMAINGVASW